MENLNKDTVEMPDGPQPIEFQAKLMPDGEIMLKCPLMGDPMRMLGLLDIIKDAVKGALKQQAEDSAPKIQPHKGGILNFARRHK
jgi:hypothetical protein